MAPIRQGDGTGLSPKGVAEVRTGAGDVLYSAGGSAIPSEKVSRATDDNTPSSGVSDKRVLQITVHDDFDKMGARISELTSDMTTAYVYDVSAGSIIATKDISGLSAGDPFGISASFVSGQSYNLLIDAGGSAYTAGYDSTDSTPVSGSSIDIESGINDTTSQNVPIGLNDVGNPDGILD